MSGSVSLINGHIDPDANRITEKEIIKALECCGNVITSSCKECSYHSTYNANCVRELMRNALDLINRQQAEIERLQTENNIFQRMQRDIISYDDMKKSIVQDFIDRLLKVRGIITLDDISKIKKEMVGK